MWKQRWSIIMLQVADSCHHIAHACVSGRCFIPLDRTSVSYPCRARPIPTPIPHTMFQVVDSCHYTAHINFSSRCFMPLDCNSVSCPSRTLFVSGCSPLDSHPFRTQFIFVSYPFHTCAGNVIFLPASSFDTQMIGQRCPSAGEINGI